LEREGKKPIQRLQVNGIVRSKGGKPMKINGLKKGTKFQWSVRVLLLIPVISAFLSINSLAKTAKEIDASVDVAVKRFYKQVGGAEEFIKASKGMLVMPNVVKGAFIIGGEYGEGALRIGGKTVDYYNTVSGSFGLQIGGQSKDIILLFMTEEALKKFRASEGWEAGIDGNVALINVGAGGRADTTTLKDPIVGFVFDAKGLIADISLKGAKFSKVDKKE
jgi:lipid-binding SYLF domain-containing protein